MGKRKQPEKDTIELTVGVDEARNAVQVENSQGDTLLKGWIIGDGPVDDNADSPVTTVDPELEREDGWEVEAFWALLTRAGYTRW